MPEAVPPSGARRPVLAEVPFGSPAYHACSSLRDEFLRRPLGLRLTDDDVRDEDGQIHIAAFSGSDIVGTVILKPATQTLVKLRQMVVAEPARGSGLGHDLVRYAERLAQDRGFTTVALNARLTASGFYERLGYRTEGELFTEVNLPHIRMVRQLTPAC